jgi:hypothetical protein
LSQIRKISKNKELNKPDPVINDTTILEKPWLINIPSTIGKYFLIIF